MKNRMRSVVMIWLIAILASLLAWSPKVNAASSQTGWNGTFPSESARLNQTLLGTNHDNYAEVSLAVDMNTIVKDVPSTGHYQFNIGVAAAADSRRGWSYSTSSGNVNWFNQFNVHTVTLGQDSGYSLDLSTMSSVDPYITIKYYGFWYSGAAVPPLANPKLFISSNGFLVLDQRATSDNGAFWTSNKPCALPSTAAPPAIIAPLWRHLKGGTIHYGTTDYDGPFQYAAFFVSWEGISNYDNSNTQTFAVIFSVDGSIKFVYKSITNDETTSIGLQDQTAQRGYPMSNQPSNNRYYSFQMVYPNDDCGIDYIKISASKTVADGSNDGNGAINIYGDPSSGGSLSYPGGINVEQETPNNNAYAGCEPVWATGSWVISGLSLVGKTIGAFLGPVGFMMDTIDYVNELWPATKTEIHNADQYTKTAYTRNLPIGGALWHPSDASVFATFVWVMGGISYHALDFNVEIGFYENGNHVTITLPQSLHISLSPSVYDWFGRTNPDGHFYNFYQISTPYTGYHIDTIGSSDYGYTMLGWNKLIMDRPEDYKVGTDGKIRVKGYFRQSDTFSASDQPGRRLLNIYIIYSDNLNKIAQTVPVLNYNDGTGWTFKALIIDLGIQNAGRSFKIGVGRPDSWLTDWNLVAEWANVQVFSGDDHPPYAPTPSGPTSGYTGYAYTYSAVTTDPDIGDNIAYQFDWNDSSTTTASWYSSGTRAYVSHYWASAGTYNVKVRAEDDYGTWSAWSSPISVVMVYGGGGGGGGCPTLFAWNGSAYVNYGVISIHNPTGEDVYREVPIQTTDLYVNNLQAKIHLQEGWPGLNFSESVIDQVQLYALDAAGNRHLCPLISAVHSRLGNVLPQLLFNDGRKVQSTLLETIDLKFIVPYFKVQSFVFAIDGCNMFKT